MITRSSLYTSKVFILEKPLFVYLFSGRVKMKGGTWAVGNVSPYILFSLLTQRGYGVSYKEDSLQVSSSSFMMRLFSWSIA